METTQWSNVDHWRKLCPLLTISDDGCSPKVFSDERPQDNPIRNVNQDLRDRLIEDGYALIDESCGSHLRERIRASISDLENRHNIPATFIILFDETWDLAVESYKLLLRRKGRNPDDERDLKNRRKCNHSVLHPSMKFNFDVLAWHIDPCKNQSGFSPHRDRQPDRTSLHTSFYGSGFNDKQVDSGNSEYAGMAKYATHWIALSDATPENSCLYMIPKQYDPGYMAGDDPEENDEIAQSGDTSKDENPLSRALSTKQSYQNIRSMPRLAGQSIIFSHRIMHWGSRGNPNALNRQPRVAISFVYSDSEFEAPYLRGEYFVPEKSNDKTSRMYPPFHVRLLLVCAQLLIYYQRLDLSADSIRACYAYCKQYSELLCESYRKKVFVEFVKAMKELPETTTSDGNGSDGHDEEALLEEMLDNHEEFEDDYDNLEFHQDRRQDGGTKRKRKQIN